MTYTITKIFKCDAGHRVWTNDMRKGRGKEFYTDNLPYLYNKCANFHGHTILIHITLESETLDEQNYVIDSDLIKVPFKKIIDEINHSFIIDKNDPVFEDFKKICEKEKLTLYIVDFSPSFEALARYFYEQISRIIKDSGLESEIKVKEVKVKGEYMTVEGGYNKNGY